jgi:predicted RNA binding protein with dsRBD fold (UPF0201 family)
MAQSAVEWYAKEHHTLLIKLENKELTIGEYVGEHHDILQQAKQMHKEQILDSYKKGFSEGVVFGIVTIYKFQTSEQYYNETYKTQAK